MKLNNALLYWLINGDDYYLYDLEEWEGILDLNPEMSDEEIEKIVNDYCNRIENVTTQVDYYDLGKCYESCILVFKFDGELYGYGYEWSPYDGTLESFGECYKVEPFTYTETRYKRCN